MKFPSRLLSLKLAIIAILSLIGTTARADDPRIVGHYAYVAERSANVDQAIDKAVADMNFIKRPIARSRLAKTNQPYQNITFTIEADKLTHVIDKRQPITAAPNGNPVKWKYDGESLDVNLRWQGNTLRETIVSNDGQRENAFELSQDGNELTMRVTISSPSLPTPLTYALIYKRQ